MLRDGVSAAGRPGARTGRAVRARIICTGGKGRLELASVCQADPRSLGAAPCQQQAGLRRRTEPNWATLACELKRPGVNLMVLWRNIANFALVTTATAVMSRPNLRCGCRGEPGISAIFLVGKVMVVPYKAFRKGSVQSTWAHRFANRRFELVCCFLPLELFSPTQAEAKRRPDEPAETAT